MAGSRALKAAPAVAAGALATLAPDDAEAMFVGERGAQGLGDVVLRGLDVAKSMLDKGELQRVIHKLTGWSVGADGKWRYEIDDSGARLLPNFTKKMAVPYYDTSPLEFGEVMSHPELVQAYGRLPRVKAGPFYDDSGAHYEAGPDKIEMGGAYRVKRHEPNARSLLLHELQHAIQQREGFDPGSNKTVYQDNLGPQIRQLVGDELTAAKDALDLRAMPGNPTPDDFYSNYGREILYPGRFENTPQPELERMVRELEMKLELNPTSEEQYMRNMGEVEARNVQRRMDMGMTERRTNLPKSTEDRPRAKQTPSPFLKYAGGGKVAKALEGLPAKIRAWHGSKKLADFDQFDPAYYKTGEGANQYGEGFYFTDSLDKAKSFAGRNEQYEEQLMRMYADAERRRDYEGMEVLERAMMHDLPFELQDQYRDAGPGYEAMVKRIAKMPHKQGIYEVEIDASDPSKFETYVDDNLDLAKYGPSTNYIVKDPSIVTILKKYGLLPAAPVAVEGEREGFAGGGRVGALSSALGDVGRGFRSVLEELITNSKQAKQTPEQWRNYLTPGRAIAEDGVTMPLKADELEWSGIADYLKAATPEQSLLRDELLEKLEKRQLPEFDERRGATEDIDWGKPLPRDWRAAADQLVDNTNSTYEDDMAADAPDLVYRALYGSDAHERGTAFEELLNNGYEDEATEIRRIMGGGTSRGATQYEDYTTRGPRSGYEENLTQWVSPDVKRWRELDRIATRTPEEQAEYAALSFSDRSKPAYSSPHFDGVGDLLAHSRGSRRDNKVRLIEEIQSDWHQAGRDKGYKGPELTERNKALRDEAWEINRQLDEATAGRPGTGSSSIYDIPAKYPELKPKVDRYLEIQKMIDESDRAVPRAPYQKTYPELEFRKQLLRAIADGDEYLAWTPGEEQIGRYGAGLRRQVDSIQWSKDADGTYSVVPIRSRNGDPSGSENVVIDERLQNLDEKGLRNLLGKEMADQITAAGDDAGELTGDDLRIGGTGMRHFYDNVIPDIAAKFAKQYGGELVEVPIDSGARDLASKHAGKGDGVVSIMMPAIRITPEMREKVRKVGVPLFSAAPVIPALGDGETAPEAFAGGGMFDPEGEGYDMESALRYGFAADETGHWPSRAELSDEEAEALQLPWGAGILLKGAGHATWSKTLAGEDEAGYRVLRRNGRYYSVPIHVEGVKGDE